MKPSLQIVFRSIEPSEAVSSKVEDHFEKLEKLCDRITGCRVVVEQGQRRHQQGNLFSVRVNLTVPDADLVASRAPDEDHAHENVYVALHDAFDAIRRQLEGYVACQRG